MKKNLTILISSLFFIAYSFDLNAPWNVMLAFCATCSLFCLSPEIIEWSSRFYRVAQRVQIRVRRLIRVMNQISQMDEAQVERMMSPQNQLQIIPVGTPVHFPIQPALGALEFSSSEKTVSPLKEISYQAEHAFSDLKKIEEAVSFYPEEEMKLILFVSVSENSREKEIIESLELSKIPSFAIQKEIFPHTDVIEVSQKVFFAHKELFYGLESICADRYKHFVFMVPKLLGHSHNAIV